MKITITASDGTEFKGTEYQDLVKEVNAYEADLKLKKEKEEAERKVREEKQKKLTQYRAAKLKEINEVISKAKVMIDEYEKETGKKLTYNYDYVNGKLVIKEVRNNFDYALDGFFQDIYRDILKSK